MELLEETEQTSVLQVHPAASAFACLIMIYCEDFMIKRIFLFFFLFFNFQHIGFPQSKEADLSFLLNDLGYYEAPGINVMVFSDFYPEGHQSGVTIVQCGTRVAANGDVRLEPAPGQWSPIPRTGQRRIDQKLGTVSVDLWYPDSSKDRKGFNPITYPDLKFRYTVKTEAIGSSIRVTVSFENPVPESWAKSIGFNLELFPGRLFGEHYTMDGTSGIFPRQANGPMKDSGDGGLQIVPMAAGKHLVIAPGHEDKEISITSSKNDIQLIDGRGLYNNGWFVLRSIVQPGAAGNAVEWIITPRIVRGWRSSPVVQVSQIGYHPKQDKMAVIELDKHTSTFEPVQLVRITADSEIIVQTDQAPVPWGRFLRYQYLRFDFSSVQEEGLYKVKYGRQESNEFEIKKDIFSRHVWQPTLEYFLPIQMCHMKVRDRYRVWHGLCHMDDAMMAPVNFNHIDGYYQHESTLTKFSPGEHVPGLNIGGWHDAGDDDLRIESQAETVYKLSLAYELFNVEYDATSIDQKTRTAELHKPDGKPDILQQIEHGLLSITGSYDSLGRFYRGMISPTIRQYAQVGDLTTVTDNLIYRENEKDPVLHLPLPKDDRLVFTEDNPRRELYIARTLAAAYRVMEHYNPALAQKCLKISKEVYKKNSSARLSERIDAAAELFLSTSEKKYGDILLEGRDTIAAHILRHCETAGRITAKLNDPRFTAAIEQAVKEAAREVDEQQKKTPYGVPYEPYIWGAGWQIQSAGVDHLFLHIGFPALFPSVYAFNALNFILGCHPGENTASFVSGVGVRSITTAYGFNRDDWSYIPGGIASGTALIYPDLPELKTWPYLWQQTEYVLGGGTTDFMILALAADRLLNK